MNVCCEPLDYHFELPERPERIVSLNAGTTETLVSLGCSDRLAAISPFCGHYSPGLRLPVAGDYFEADEALLEEIGPDLILISTGIQRSLGQQLIRRGLPVYALPLPSSLYGILENIITLAGLVNVTAKGRKLCNDMLHRIEALRSRIPTERPKTYVELWIGEDVRTIGGRSYVHDVVFMAGGNPLFENRREGYLPLSEEILHAAADGKPDIFLGYSEPGYPVDFPGLIRERGWDSPSPPRVIVSEMKRGRSLVHEGPSIIDAIEWLHREISGG